MKVLVAFGNRWRLKRQRFGWWLTHFALLFILAGAVVSFLTGRKGMLHLREGEKSNRVYIPDRMDTFVLPFSVGLEKFILKRYPGSDTPSSYESDVTVYLNGRSYSGRILMNRAMQVKGYRFFQASYDSDEAGSILYVSYDPVGRYVVCVGCFLLFGGFVFSWVDKNSRVRRLGRRLKKWRDISAGWLLFPVLLAVSFAAEAQGHDDWEREIGRYAVKPEHAARFGALSVRSTKGRILPMNTFSSEILRKLYQSARIGTLDSDQFLIAFLAMPDLWMRIPFVACSSPELSACYGLSEKGCAYAEVFDGDGHYRLREKLEEAYRKPPAERTRFDKDLMKLDERIHIFRCLLHRQILRLFPRKESAEWYAPGDDLSGFAGEDSLFVSRIFDDYLEKVRLALQDGDWSEADEAVGRIAAYQQVVDSGMDSRKINAELRYNKLHLFRWCRTGYLILGGLLLFLLLVGTFFRRRKGLGRMCGGLCVAVVPVFCLHTWGIGMRGYIAGYAPWSNAYETMVYVAWTTVMAGVLFVRRSRVVFAAATLFGGVILFVSGLNWMDPEITPLMPVLDSPWLMFHVAVVVAAYGFFGIGCLTGFVNLVMMAVVGKRNAEFFRIRIRKLSVVNEMALWTGLVLMTAGTCLGAVWADESWGRYWGWDPKETWALITIAVYVAVTHLHLVKRWYNPWLFNLCSVLAFTSVLMTFFGVNYFFGGIHAYGWHDDVSRLFGYVGLAYGWVFLWAVLGHRYLAVISQKGGRTSGTHLCCRDNYPYDEIHP